MIEEKYKTTSALLKMARQDKDPVSFYAVGYNWKDAQEAIFVVKGKRNLQRVFDTLVGLGLTSTNPVDSDAEICPNCGTRMPEGCKGIFKSDGASCWLNNLHNAEVTGA